MDGAAEQRGRDYAARDRASLDEGALTRSEAARLIWEWREYRNGVMWGSVYRWGAVSLLVAIAPYVLPDIIEELGFTVLVFPALAALISFYAAYLIAVQYRLYKQVDREFRKLLGDYAPPDFSQERLVDRLLTISFGRVLPGAFLLFSVPLQIVSAVLLASLV